MYAQVKVVSGIVRECVKGGAVSLSDAMAGDHRTILVAIRDDLAKKVDETESGRDYAAMVKSLVAVEDRIYQYDIDHGAFAPQPESSPLARAQERHAARGA